MGLVWPGQKVGRKHIAEKSVRLMPGCWQKRGQGALTKPDLLADLSGTSAGRSPRELFMEAGATSCKTFWGGGIGTSRETGTLAAWAMGVLFFGVPRKQNQFACTFPLRHDASLGRGLS
jgi:hypothetical protein